MKRPPSDRIPGDRRRYPWITDPTRGVVYREDPHYEIYFFECATAADLVDRLIHASRQPHMTEESLGQLVVLLLNAYIARPRIGLPSDLGFPNQYDDWPDPNHDARAPQP
jgi:hypothetical protein